LFHAVNVTLNCIVKSPRNILFRIAPKHAIFGQKSASCAYLGNSVNLGLVYRQCKSNKSALCASAISTRTFSACSLNYISLFHQKHGSDSKNRTDE